MSLFPRGNKRRGNKKRLSLGDQLKAALDFKSRRRARFHRAKTEDVDSAAGEAASSVASLLSRKGKGNSRGGKRRQQRSKGRGQRSMWRVALSILAWVLPAGVAVGAFVTPLLGVKAYHYVMEAGHFHVREVFIDGNVRVSYEEISELAGLGPGAHVLKLSTDEVAGKLEAHPWVAKATVEKRLPDRLTIRILEHRPVAYVAIGELVLVNGSGEPFALAGPDDTMDLPIITGIRAEDFEDPVRGEVAEADVRAAVNLSRLYDQMGLGVRWPISELRVEAGRSFTIVLSDVGTEVVLGLGPYRDKLYRLEWILENLRREGKAAEYVLLDGRTSGGGFGAVKSLGDEDTRVVVKADIAPTREELARQAAARAEEAKKAAATPQQADMFQPSADGSGDDKGKGDTSDTRGGDAKPAP